MESSVRVGRIVINTDSYIIVSCVGFQASETYCVVVFLLQLVLDFSVQIVVLEGVLGGCGTPFTYDDVVNVRILCFCSLSLSLSLVGVIVFFQDQQEEFCLYAAYKGANQCSVILRPTFVACFEVVLLHGEF